MGQAGGLAGLDAKGAVSVAAVEPRAALLCLDEELPQPVSSNAALRATCWRGCTMRCTPNRSVLISRISGMHNHNMGHVARPSPSAPALPRTCLSPLERPWRSVRRSRVRLPDQRVVRPRPALERRQNLERLRMRKHVRAPAAVRLATPASGRGQARQRRACHRPNRRRVERCNTNGILCCNGPKALKPAHHSSSARRTPAQSDATRLAASASASVWTICMMHSDAPAPAAAHEEQWRPAVGHTFTRRTAARLSSADQRWPTRTCSPARTARHAHTLTKGLSVWSAQCRCRARAPQLTATRNRPRAHTISAAAHASRRTLASIWHRSTSMRFAPSPPVAAPPAIAAGSAREYSESSA